MSAYKGTTVSGFPNLFMICGPNTAQGHTSVVFVIESQVAYIRDAVRTMRRGGYAALEPRADVQRRYNARLQRRMRRTVWSRGGCMSWYQDAQGRITTLWPRSTVTLRRHPGPVRRRGLRRAGRTRGRAVKTVDDKVVVITGAASGIGRALAVDVARRGALVAISDIDEAGLAETVDLVKAAGAREVHAERLDVADRAAFAAYATAVVEQLGRVNVMVNNAGVALAGDVEDLDYPDMDWIIGVDFWGVVQGTKEFLPHLIASGDGHLVTMSSLFGLVSMPGQSMYNAAKYAVRGFSEALREEMLMAGHPVGVTVVHPGGIKTAIVRNARTSAREDHDRIARLLRRDARQDGARGGGAAHRREGHPRRQGPAAGGARRPRAAPLRPADRVALPGRRRCGRQAHQAAQALTGAERGRVGIRAVRFELGTPVRIEMEKWGGRPHWHIPARWLGRRAR